MPDAYFKLERPINEPVRGYAPGCAEKTALKAKMAELKSRTVEIPLIIGGEEVATGDFGTCIVPHDHGCELGRFHRAGQAEVDKAVAASQEAWEQWSRMAIEDRIAVFMRAAELLAGPYRDLLNAATMLNQSKNAFQAEIDAACEFIDFLRFNCWFAQRIYEDQPISSSGIWNRSEYRPLEGFVFAVSPFNFTSIGGNLCTAPAIMGNTVLWKPASTAVYASWCVMRLLKEAGLPDGVINFLPGSGGKVGTPVLNSEHLAGVHFTGSTAVFQDIWRTIGGGIANYRSYPRIVGETGGKDFIFAHASADPQALVTAMVRGAFEYQGQKCSAASRAYIPRSLWEQIEKPLIETTESLAMGDPEDFSNFVNAVIDKAAFQSITGYIDEAKQSKDCHVLAGGDYDDSTGYFIRPTIIRADKPNYRTMVEEIFGPVLSVYVYPDDRFSETLAVCDGTSPYGLTGAIFANDRAVVVQATAALRHAAGNFYINDKPTGAVVGQQPFGGSRASGTNDKAGAMWNLVRWMTPRTLKENFNPPTDYRYPFMGES